IAHLAQGVADVRLQRSGPLLQRLPPLRGEPADGLGGQRLARGPDGHGDHADRGALQAEAQPPRFSFQGLPDLVDPGLVTAQRRAAPRGEVLAGQPLADAVLQFLNELLHVAAEAVAEAGRQRDGDRLVGLLKVVDVDPVGWRRARDREVRDLLAGIGRPPRADRPGDEEVVRRLRDGQAKVQGADGAFLPHDDLFRLEVGGGFKSKKRGVTAPAQGVGRQAKALPQVAGSLSHRGTSVAWSGLSLALAGELDEPGLPASAGRLRLGDTRGVRDVEVQFLAARADEGLRLSGVDPDVAGGLGPPPRGLDGAGALLFLVLRAAHLAGAGAAQFVQQRLGVIDAVAAAAAAAGGRQDVRPRLPLWEERE